MSCATSSSADGRLGSGAWLLGLELQEREFDTMSAGDSRPIPRGESGVRLSVDRLLSTAWAFGLSGHFGGAWLDWSDPVYNTSGKIEDTGWSTRVGVDRVFALGEGGTGFAGIGIEYGEAHSWLHTLGVDPATGLGGQNISDEGPRCYMTGGYARFLAVTPAWRGVAGCAQVSASIYGAHASDPPFGLRYDWLGRSLAVSAGLRFVVARGK